MNPDAARRDRILDAWANGEQARPIAIREGIGWGAVREIVRIARKMEDPRALKLRTDKSKGGDVDNSAFWSHSQLLTFDYAFKTAMLSAIAQQLERADIGVYRWKKASS